MVHRDFIITIIRILIMDGMTINHIVSIDHGSFDIAMVFGWP